MTISREDIARTAQDAYTLSHQKLADALKAALLASMLATYRRAGSRIGSGSAGAWQPSSAQEAVLAQMAGSAAAGIAATFTGDVVRYVDSYLRSVEEAGTPGGWRAAIAGLIGGVKSWLTAHLAAKAPPIANATTGAGSEAGTGAFVDDFVDGEFDDLPDGIDPQNVEIAVVPEESSGDFCKEYAGKTYAIEDYQLLPEFPAHPNCGHLKIIQYSDDAEDEESAA